MSALAQKIAAIAKKGNPDLPKDAIRALAKNLTHQNYDFRSSLLRPSGQRILSFA